MRLRLCRWLRYGKISLILDIKNMVGSSPTTADIFKFLLRNITQYTNKDNVSITFLKWQQIWIFRCNRLGNCRIIIYFFWSNCWIYWIGSSTAIFRPLFHDFGYAHMSFLLRFSLFRFIWERERNENLSAESQSKRFWFDIYRRSVPSCLNSELYRSSK